MSLGSVQRGPFQMGYVGYWIDEALAGQGYVPEGVVLMMRHAFETLQLHRLEAAIVPRNAPSRRVAEKLGLRDEGVAVRFLQIQPIGRVVRVSLEGPIAITKQYRNRAGLFGNHEVRSPSLFRSPIATDTGVVFVAYMV